MADPNESGTGMATIHEVAPPSGERIAWLIEAAGPHYLAVSEVLHRFHWTAHADSALQLATEKQANALRDAVKVLEPGLFPDCYPMPRATEHLWMAPRTGEQK